ncbi:hypothetical protein EIP91_004917 [Steccherinum ochraceum]|uniref:Uncharacterized protein n=1 Tax=Steccherinum ochraceum TaxID=92696 RepID=A0A4R0R8M4_9APHY|nr:hypothetical protein EIP91_004917 [Steccherinum ochraceum]
MEEQSSPGSDATIPVFEEDHPTPLELSKNASSNSLLSITMTDPVWNDIISPRSGNDSAQSNVTPSSGASPKQDDALPKNTVRDTSKPASPPSASPKPPSSEPRRAKAAPASALSAPEFAAINSRPFTQLSGSDLKNVADHLVHTDSRKTEIRQASDNDSALETASDAKTYSISMNTL